MIAYKLRDWVANSFGDDLNWFWAIRYPKVITAVEQDISLLEYELASANPALVDLLEANPDKINWSNLSGNPAAIHLLEANPEKIDWTSLSSNPAAIHLLEANPEKIDWSSLSGNPAAKHLLEANLDKISWKELHFNKSDAVSIFETNLDKVDWWFLSKNPFAINILKNNIDKRPSFGIELGNPTHCVAHKFDVMIDVVSKRCEQDGCIKQASFNYIDELAKYCGQHKSADMVNIRATYCITEDCNIQASIIRYKGYCFSCFCQHPDYKNEPIIRNYKIKESAIMRSISELIETPIICDKIINGGCSKRRPDGLIQLDGRNIIIEIDENQHKNLGYENEEIRISEIYNDLNQAPLTIIRFNPDGYNRISNGLFTKNANGIVEVIHPERYANAIKELIQVIEDAIKNNPVGNISIIKLRFDSL